MYSGYTSSVIKKFVYAIMILLGLSSLIALLGFIFAGVVPQLPLTLISGRIVSFATVLLFVQAIIMPLVFIFRINRLSYYLPYFIGSVISIGLYLAAWVFTPNLSEYFGIVF